MTNFLQIPGSFSPALLNGATVPLNTNNYLGAFGFDKIGGRVFFPVLDQTGNTVSKGELFLKDASSLEKFKGELATLRRSVVETVSFGEDYKDLHGKIWSVESSVVAGRINFRNAKTDQYISMSNSNIGSQKFEEGYSMGDFGYASHSLVFQDPMTSENPFFATSHSLGVPNLYSIRRALSLPTIVTDYSLARKLALNVFIKQFGGDDRYLIMKGCSSSPSCMESRYERLTLEEKRYENDVLYGNKVDIVIRGGLELQITSASKIPLIIQLGTELFNELWKPVYDRADGIPRSKILDRIRESLEVMFSEK